FWTNPSSHKFNDLVGSDQATFTAKDSKGNTVFDFQFDYIGTNNSTPSGFASLGAAGGDGKVNTGSASDLIQFKTSLDYDLNVIAHGTTFNSNSPVPDNANENSTSTPGAAGWVFNIEYEGEISAATFGANRFGSLTLDSVHDSPNKFGGMP